MDIVQITNLNNFLYGINIVIAENNYLPYIYFNTHSTYMVWDNWIFFSRFTYHVEIMEKVVTLIWAHFPDTSWLY